MALWTDHRKLLLVGSSGLQYRSEVRTALTPQDAMSVLCAFYERRGAIRDPRDSGPDAVSFTRGSKWLGWLSWLMLMPETWPHHEIRACVREDAAGSVVSVSYDAWMYFNVIVRPNSYEKELRALATELARA